MIHLNLLPDVKREFLKAKRDQARVISVAILSVLVVGGVTVALAVWVYAVQNIHIGLLSQNIKDNAAKIEAIPDVNKYVTLQNQLANLSKLHDGKNDFSRLLTILPTLNPKSPNNVALASVTLGTEESTISLEGRVSDFTGLITFRDILQNAELEYRTDIEDSEVIKEKLFSEVAILEQGLSKTAEGNAVVSFKIIVRYNPAAFINSSKDVTVSVPKLETTPSKQGSPDLFTSDNTTSQEGN
ncbi:MAG TPA: hypothetical protein PKD68_02820 [Candidatus Saccharibacteria bacterium]|nr:hypothetical protein [Candidatus Saccharibacteria bacterium]